MRTVFVNITLFVFFSQASLRRDSPYSSQPGHRRDLLAKVTQYKIISTRPSSEKMKTNNPPSGHIFRGLCHYIIFEGGAETIKFALFKPIENQDEFLKMGLGCVYLCVSRNFMKLFIIFSFLVSFSSCFDFSMQTGPEPHSIKFDKASFELVSNYFVKTDQISFVMEKVPKNIPDNIVERMKEIGFLEFRNLGEYKVFFCGYGVVGKGWGFIMGNFTDEQIAQPPFIESKEEKLYLSFLERLESNWYRFATS